MYEGFCHFIQVLARCTHSNIYQIPFVGSSTNSTTNYTKLILDTSNLVHNFEIIKTVRVSNSSQLNYKLVNYKARTTITTNNKPATRALLF